MKYLLSVLCLCAGLTAHSELNPVISLQRPLVFFTPGKALDWRVGENASYSLSNQIFNGTMTMKVREEVSEGFWMDQVADINGQQQKVEILFNKEGQPLKIIANGQEQEIPDASNMEVVESKEDTVEVPAGTFQSVYIKMRNKQDNSESEVWVNMKEIPVLGVVKDIEPSQFGPITLELTAFEN